MNFYDFIGFFMLAGAVLVGVGVWHPNVEGVAVGLLLLWAMVSWQAASDERAARAAARRAERDEQRRRRS